MTRPLALAALLSLGATALVAVAAPADAATGSTIRALGGVHTIEFVAGAGEANNLRGTNLPLTQDGETYIHHYRFTDTYVIAAGSGCSYPTTDHRTVDCELPDIGDYYPQFDIRLGDGNDRIKFAENVGQDSVLDAGPGNDVVDGTTFWSIKAGDGNDRVTGGGSILGGAGNDTLTAAELTDYIAGGRGNDVITGSDGVNRLYGNSGNDTIRAGRGDDTVSGGAGNDVLYGNSGDDTIAGGPGTDRISGGPGSDRITP